MWRVMASAPTGPMPMVYPSGSLFATASMPMVSAPPGRLSTTTGWPSCFAIPGETSRATLSVALPAACGTTKRTGRSGYRSGDCAAAMLAAQPRTSSQLRLQLRTDLAALLRVAVHVDVEVAGLQVRHLRVGELLALRHAVGVALLGARDDHRAVLSLGAAVDVRHGALDALGRDAAADRAVALDAEA